MTMKEALDLEYKIANAYRMADMFRTGSDKWHKWMNEANRLNDKLHGRN